MTGGDMNEHIRIASGTLELQCLACGEKYKPRLPCSVDIWLAMARAFEKLHKDCRLGQIK